jgi:GMP synthase (glutamine-hydrolysing)
VCAALLKKALRPDQIVALHIDNGFMRMKESEKVLESLQVLEMNVELEKASQEFYFSSTTLENGTRTELLNRTTDPEVKRKIIGDTFIHVAERRINQMNLDDDQVLLCQGTLRPDLIESASHLATAGGLASTIKTHHNDTGLVRKLRADNKVVEPLKDFHKDEVRAIGRKLGLPENLVTRRPYPGPGLAIRVICATTPHLDVDFGEIEVVAKVVVQYQQMAANNHALLNRIDNSTSEADRQLLSHASGKQRYNATLLPIRTVGVQGDHRSYSYCVGISCEGEPIWEDLKIFSRIITQVCHGINRVVFIFGPIVQNPVHDITRTTLTPQVLSIVRQADHVANKVLSSSSASGNISQMPVVLLPVHMDRSPLKPVPSVARAIVLRPFITEDFMTGEFAVPGRDIPLDIVQKMVSEILSVDGVSRVMYDITNKPPGTTEWE